MKITVDQSHAVMSTFAVNVDWSAVDFTLLQKRIKEDPKGMGRDFTQFLQAEARMPPNNVINMDVPSKRAPKNWEVRKGDQLPNRVCGQVEWNPTKSSLYLSEKQKTSYSGGHDLRKELEGREVYGDNLLDWYMDHPEVPTPKEWLGKWVFFWGRIYRDSYGYSIVRCLCCRVDGSRESYCYYLGHDFDSHSPALFAGK